MGWFKELLDDKRNIGRYAQVPAYFNFIGLGNEHDRESGNVDQWVKNSRINLKWLQKNSDKVIGSIDALPSYENHAVIFVGMSPNIRKSWKYLKGLDERFIIVATNSSAKYLLDKGINPHYVIAIDGKPGSWSLDLGDRINGTIGLFSVNLDPQAMQDWPGKIMVIPYGIGDKRTKAKIQELYGLPIQGGGNSINAAVMIFLTKTAANMFLFVGNELSFKKRYYADRACKHDEEVKFYAKDVKGRKVKTLFPLYEYKVWLENLASQFFGDYAFFNCSEGILGVDTDGTPLRYINQMPLDEAISTVKEAWEFEELPVSERARIIYEEAYKAGKYTPYSGQYTWDFILKQDWQFKNALDVGCGMGWGVAKGREQGLQVWGVDFVDNPHWVEMGIQQYCSVAPAHLLPYPENEFDLVVCTEVMEHIPEELVMESLKSIYRVGSDRFFFTIALQKEEYPVAGICESHITIKPSDWWCDRLIDAGFKDVKINVWDYDKPVTKKKVGAVVYCNKHAKD